MARTSHEVQRIQQTVGGALTDLRRGRPVLVIHNYRDTGHLVAAARHVTPETIGVMGRLGRGVLRAAMPADHMQALGIASTAGPAADGRTYGSSLDLRGHDRPLSSVDRAATLAALDAPDGATAPFTSPGHVVPVETRPGGLLASPHLPEAATELARLAGAGVGAYIDYADSSGLAGISSDPERQRQLGASLGLAVLTVRDLITELEWSDQAARRVVSVDLPTLDGLMQAVGYRALRTEAEFALAVVYGDPAGKRSLAHVHFRCPVSDVFGGLDCGCREILGRSREAMRRLGHGVVLYSDWGEERPLGHFLPARPVSRDPKPGHEFRPRREREIAAVLRDLGIHSVELSSNEPVDARFLEALGVEVVGQPTMRIEPGALGG